MSAAAALAIFVAGFFFIATEKVDKVKAALVAAGLMIVLGLTPGSEVFFSEHEGIDWNVIFLLLGMMIIVGVIKQTGLFDFLAIWAAKRSRGRPYRLMVMLMAITAVASPLLDNVTIVMLVAPVTVVVCNRLDIPAQPYLIAGILAAKRRAITDPRLLARCLVVLAGVVAGFALHSVLHLEPSMIALVGAGVMLLVSGADVHDTLREVEWPTLVFFMGLFVMVAGLVHTGVIATIGEQVIATVGDNYLGAATALLFGSAVLGAFFDNIPYTATMAPIVEGLVAQVPDPATGQALWWAFALGADFGGNGTAVAASANVVTIGIAARMGHPISFWQFTRYGIVVTLLSTAMAWVYVWLRYFL